MYQVLSHACTHIHIAISATEAVGDGSGWRRERPATGAVGDGSSWRWLRSAAEGAGGSDGSGERLHEIFVLNFFVLLM